MKTTPKLRFNLRPLACAAALLASLSFASAQTTNVIFNDTFDDGAGGLATRNDDVGTNFGLDIQWQPRVIAQAGDLSVINDTTFGPALQFHDTGNNLWIIGQFDNDASDGVTLGSNSVPATLGTSPGSTLTFSMQFRTSATTTGANIQPGLDFIPGGPLPIPEGQAGGPTANTWNDPSVGYFLTIPLTTAPGKVTITKQIGSTTVTPYSGAAIKAMTNGFTNTITVGDTLPHTIQLTLTRVAAGVQIDAFIDGVQFGDSLDNGAAAIGTNIYTQFNSFEMAYNATPVPSFIMDNVQLVSVLSASYFPPVAANDAYTLGNNTVLTVPAPGVLANDTSFTNAPMTATKLTNPTNGTLTSFNSNGSFTYQPNSNFFGADSFTYMANDGTSNSSPATVNLTVIGYATWNGAVSGSWITAGNWAANDLPAGQNVRYDSTSTANFTETLDTNWNITSLTVSNVASPVTILNGFNLTNTGILDLSGASSDLTILANYTPTIAGEAVAVGAGRTVTVSNVSGNLNSSVGPGTLRVTGIMNGQALDSTGSLTILVDGGSIISAPPVRLAAEAGGLVRVIVTNNGTLNQNGGASVKINVGNSSTTGTNELDLDSGNISMAASTSTANNGLFVPSATCLGIFNLNGGTVTLSNKLTSITNVTGETTLRIPSVATGNGIVNLNGGTLITPLIDSTPPTTGSGTLNFNGTTVTANRSNNVWISGIEFAYVSAGGAIFDTSNYDVTIPQNLTAPPVGTSGGLTKLGSGILRMSGFSSYTGTTLVANGTMFYTNAASTYPSGSPLALNSGVTLNLDLTGPATVLTPGVTLNGATLNLAYGQLFGDPGAAAINSADSTGVALSATGNNVINISASGLTVGQFPLIVYSGTIGGGGFSAIHLGSLPSGIVGHLVDSGTSVDLFVTASGRQLTWFGAASTNWDTTTADWDNGVDIYQEYTAPAADYVTFDDTLDPNTLHTNVNLTASRRPGGVFFNNSSYRYNLSGAGKLTGTMALGKDGAAGVTLTTANDYTGGSFLTNGLVNVGNNQALGAGTVSLLGASLSSDSATTRTMSNAVIMATMNLFSFGDGVNPGSLILTGPVDFGGVTNVSPIFNVNVTLAGPLGDGGIGDKTGAGTLTLTGVSTNLSGEMHIHNGAVVVTGGGKVTKPRGSVLVLADQINGSALLEIDAGSSLLFSGSGQNVQVGSANPAGDPSATNTLTVGGILSWTTNAGSAGQIQLGASGAEAILNLVSGGLLQSGSIAPGGNTAVLNLNGGTLAGVINSASYLQGLTQANVQSNGVIINTQGLTGQPLNLTIGQSLLDAGGGGGLTKNGLGTLTLRGTNTYTGMTLVNAGTLLLGSSDVAPGLAKAADGAVLGFAPDSTNATTRIGSAQIGTTNGAGLSVVFPAQTGTPAQPYVTQFGDNPTQPGGFVTNLMLTGTVPVSVQLPNVLEGVVPLIGYASLSGSGTITTGTLPPGVTGVVTNDTAAKLIKLIVSVSPAPVYSTVIFDDTFEPDPGTGNAATRGDDAGDPLDIIWRTRANTGSQNSAANFGVTNDTVMGNCLFYNGTGDFYVVGQWDNDPSDGITTFPTNVNHTGGSFVSLGANVGDKLRYTMDFRTTAVNPVSSLTFRMGLFLDPDGPLQGAETSVNTWDTDNVGYFMQASYATNFAVSTWKETGDVTQSPMAGTDITQLSAGTGAQVGIGADTNKHTVRFDVIRGQGSVTFNTYWDNVQVSGATDSSSPYDQYNTFMMQVITSGSFYLIDNAQLQALAAPPSSSVPPVISSVSASGGNVVLSGTVGGTPGGSYTVLTTTNLTLPLTNWVSAGSSLFDGGGHFSFSSAINPAVPQQFFLLRVP